MKSVKDFILHLRLNYNFLILSTPFILGALYLPEIVNLASFIYLFILVYIFLFGGANAYNSFFDKDEGPIGGLEHPPKMEKWMYYGAWAFQFVGFFLAISTNFIFGLLFLFSIIMFWLYSSPLFRFKGKPLLSFLILGVGAVFNITFMGYIASGGDMISLNLILGGVGATLIILSMYPFSQAYQIDDDLQRGDITFAVKYGIQGVKKNYLVLFLLGILILSYSFRFNIIMAVLSLLTGVVAYILIWQFVKTISGNRNEYHKVMRVKYYGGLFFTLAIVLLINLF